MHAELLAPFAIQILYVGSPPALPRVLYAALKRDLQLDDLLRPVGALVVNLTYADTVFAIPMFIEIDLSAETE
jgi:hypothetical protein